MNAAISGQGATELPSDSAKTLWIAAIAALVLEMAALVAVGENQRWLSHPQQSSPDTQFIEAQVFQAPKETHLIDQSKPVAAPAKQEATLSKVPGKGKKAKPEDKSLTDENQTQGGQKLAPTHGPVVVTSPAPVIPSYLQNQDLHASVVIDFYVSAVGNTNPKLVGSSGNQELDAIALDAAKKWQFRPAEKDHHAVDSKVRLRILFEVK